MRRTRAMTLLMAGTLVAAACGDEGVESTPTDAVVPEVTAAPTSDGDVFSETDGESSPAPESEAAEPAAAESDTEAVEEPASDPATEPAAEPVAEPAAEPEPEPVAEPAPEPEPAVTPAEIGGRALGDVVSDEANFDGNPLPDLLVDDVARGTKVNIRNILPSDRPVLLWTWAPH